MKLNVQERLTLVNLLPEKGNFTTMSIVETLKDILYPSEAEVKKFELKQTERILTWNEEGSKGVEIEISEMQSKMLSEKLEELSGNDDLDVNQYQMLKRFRNEKAETVKT